ncbi:hypothetical protein C8034_v006989 [Colletotrichum sidae]|uniref:Uncharacterized protein n=1 Tax=Colletotrichum sidae TaxID=1347389 RepID=A0A4V3I1V2_9PEZI|nr:hypothetical protein C8034_v006989 [Colletotrichum sidae]
MGLESITNIAKQFAGNDQSKKDQQQQQQGPTQTDDKSWADVGSAAQTAYANLKTNRAQGEGADYTEIGGIAKDAYDKYSREGGQESDVGKAIAAGFEVDVKKGEGEEGYDDHSQVQKKLSEKGGLSTLGVEENVSSGDGRKNQTSSTQTGYIADATQRTDI